MQKKLFTILFSFLILSAQICANDLYRDHQIELLQLEEYTSPSIRFNQANPKYNIDSKLNYYGATENNKAMFQQMIANEKPGFIGYHGGCSNYRIFQDVIKIAIEEYLGIPIRNDFQFLRTPGNPDFSFESADAFVNKYPKYDDNFEYIRKHIFSINIALFNSWFADWDFTPRYFLQNKPWSQVGFENELSPFFKKIGLDTAYIKKIFEIARKHVPQNKGVILQLFDRSHNSGLMPYSFLNEQGYVGTSTIKTDGTTPSQYYLNSNDTKFPQLRLVMNNANTLNPNSPLIILRYHTMTPAKEDAYEETLRAYMRALPFDENKAEHFRNELIKYWY